MMSGASGSRVPTTVGSQLRALSVTTLRSSRSVAVAHSCSAGPLVVATLAAVTLTLARLDSAVSVLAPLLGTLLFVGGAWSWWGWQRSARQSDRARQFYPLVVLGASILPLPCEVVWRQFGYGEPFELILLVCLQNAALILAAQGDRPRGQRLACVTSAFLALFAMVISADRSVFVMAAIFGFVLLWWLTAYYWERIHQAHAADRVDLCLPVRMSLLVGIVFSAGGMLAVLSLTPASTYVLRGFMPSSGGEKSSSEFARAGVGDGDAMVAAQQEAMSFGPVESELFLDSDMPTLYDMFNEMYGEPAKPKKSPERSIGLAPGEILDIEQRIAKTQRNGREFSTLRRKSDSRRASLGDRDAPAMLYVVGRVPLHLALERFDHFDGREWGRTLQTMNTPPIRLTTRQDQPWITLTASNPTGVAPERHRHALKIINLKTNRVPAPPQLAAIHIDKLDQLDFFDWTEDGSLAMTARDSIPQLTVVHLESNAIALRELRASDFTRQGSLQTIGKDYLQLPSHNQLAANLAAEWTRPYPRGWMQVEAVVHHLREEYELTPVMRSAHSESDAVTQFLTSRRGPDYMFATAATVMLRSQGYPARFVTGLYAHEKRYDRRARQTSVLAEDVHAWVEVCVDGQAWIPIEPTPGYDPPLEMLTWDQRYAAWCLRNMYWLQDHWQSLGLTGSMAVFAWWTRMVWCDWLLQLVFWCAGLPSKAQRVRATLQLLEWRAWLAGKQRPLSTTIGQWYLTQTLDAPLHESLQSFTRVVDQLLYAPQGLYERDWDGALAACGRVARHVTARRLHQQST